MPRHDAGQRDAARRHRLRRFANGTPNVAAHAGHGSSAAAIRRQPTCRLPPATGCSKPAGGYFVPASRSRTAAGHNRMQPQPATPAACRVPPRSPPQYRRSCRSRTAPSIRRSHRAAPSASPSIRPMARAARRCTPTPRPYSPQRQPVFMRNASRPYNPQTPNARTCGSAAAKRPDRPGRIRRAVVKPIEATLAVA